MVLPRRFQHTFGRSIQTKILDAVWNQRRQATNIRILAKTVRQSYVYTTLAVSALARQGLLLKERRGVEVMVRPNEAHPVIRWMAKRR